MAWFGVLFLLALTFAAGYSCALLRAGRTRARRRGGFVGLGPASGSMSPRTVARVATYTGCSPDGPPAVGEVRPKERLGASRTFALTGYGAASGGNRGADARLTTALEPYSTQVRPALDPWSRKVPPA